MFEMFEMLMHHLIVLSILFMSYAGNILFLTTYCLMLHDSTDILLEAAKLSGYFSFANSSVILTVALSLAWGYNRLYLFSLKVVIPLFLSSNDQKRWGLGMFGDENLNGVKKLAFGLIVVIMIMNVYWFVLMTRMTYRVIWGGDAEEKRDRALTDLSTDNDASEIDTETEFESHSESEVEEESKKNQ